MKALDALTASHLRQVLRPRRTAWFDQDEQATSELRTIGSLIRAAPCVFDEGAPLAEVAREIVDHDVPAVAVVDPDSSLCGVITATDLLRAEDSWTAADAMSSVVKVRATTTIEETAALMVRENVNQVIVTDQIGQALGVVSALDIARHLALRSGRHAGSR
jgi:CBS domain-containing protein